MKKILIRVLIGVCAAGVLFAGFGGVVRYRMQKEIALLTPVPSGQVASDLYVIRDTFANFYIVKTGDTYAAIDAGNDMEEDARQMAALQIDPLKVTALFLTHTDGDHVASVSLFKNAIVYISRSEEQLLNGKTHRFLFFGNKLPCSYTLLDDNQTVTAGGASFRVILTPGHTPGSVCYVVNNVYLFTGDTIGLRDGIAGKFSDLFNMDTATQLVYQEQLKKLTGISAIYTAHHGSSYNFARTFGLTK